ncbi:hypothetical protein [Adhaeribacter radiodurans]|uniref:Uncharacterized protein n=1 Tax=Adhaeribacter radiodurans TaxID=2745197 RepID=A0A7L7LC10_9BACT|nr:hypothetical protein [Adhaeribacter radiodurans]QMU30382.1 hypothetical protein HUW48_21195 [Adhaeribacter radiodurans]
MTLLKIKKKTRQQLIKQFRKTIIKHGSEVAIALATSFITALITEIVENTTGKEETGHKNKRKKKKHKKEKK